MNTKDDVLDRLTSAYEDLSPQLRKAAQFVLENPNDIGVKSIHEVADAAEVHPNTLVRMANAVGFSGYRTFRRPFSEYLRQGGDSFQDRARWLQSIAARRQPRAALWRDRRDRACQHAEPYFPRPRRKT